MPPSQDEYENLLAHSIPQDLVAKAIGVGIGHPFLFRLLQTFGPIAQHLVADLIDSITKRVAAKAPAASATP
jgi:hypothetical protein